MGKVQKRVREKKPSTVQRTALLTHDTKEKRDTLKLKLHLSRTKRRLDELRHRLSNWDPLEEEQEKRKQLAKTSTTAEEEPEKKKKRGRSDPSTWKLKGAARPAHLVYNFDTRYRDPNELEQKAAAAKAARTVNLFSTNQLLLQHDEGRDFLELLLEFADLNVSSKNYKVARECYEEVIQLEGDTALTTARESLMELYLETSKFESAVQLAKQYNNNDDDKTDDSSVLLQYSGALASINLGNHNNTTILQDAVKYNEFCAYYICYYETFDAVFEHVDELEQWDDPQSSLEEALLYCHHYAALWRQTEGAVEALKAALLLTNRHGYKDKLQEIQKAKPELEMYVGMFETAMEMIAEAGKVA